MMGFYNFGFGGIFMWIFWGLIIWAFISMLRGGGSCLGGGCHSGHDKSSANDKALEILKERYAKGDISKKEFEEKKKDLIG